MINTSPTSVRGYTLVEMIVAVGIFSLVMLTATAAYLTLIDLDRKSRAVTQVVTNLSFAVDSMSRSIRTGTAYSCNGGTNCTTGGTTLSFVDEFGRTITYAVASGVVTRQCSGSSCGGTSAVQLTDPGIVVNTLRFYVRGVGTGDGLQPQVTFTVQGTVSGGARNTPTTFTIQGGATERKIEL